MYGHGCLRVCVWIFGDVVAEQCASAVTWECLVCGQSSALPPNCCCCWACMRRIMKICRVHGEWHREAKQGAGMNSGVVQIRLCQGMSRCDSEKLSCASECCHVSQSAVTERLMRPSHVRAR